MEEKKGVNPVPYQKAYPSSQTNYINKRRKKVWWKPITETIRHNTMNYHSKEMKGEKNFLNLFINLFLFLLFMSCCSSSGLLGLPHLLQHHLHLFPLPLATNVTAKLKQTKGNLIKRLTQKMVTEWWVHVQLKKKRRWNA